jgi:hypothetical protein
VGQALHVAIEQRLAFGQDIVFTFGPLGFTATRLYWPGLFAVTLVFWAALAAGILDAWSGLARQAGRWSLFAWPLFAATVVFASAFAFDVFVFTYLLLWVMHVEVDDDAAAPRLAAHGILVGVIALSKITFAVAGRPRPRDGGGGTGVASPGVEGGAARRGRGARVPGRLARPVPGALRLAGLRGSQLRDRRRLRGRHGAVRAALADVDIRSARRVGMRGGRRVRHLATAATHARRLPLRRRHVRVRVEGDVHAPRRARDRGAGVRAARGACPLDAHRPGGRRMGRGGAHGHVCGTRSGDRGHRDAPAGRHVARTG